MSFGKKVRSAVDAIAPKVGRLRTRSGVRRAMGQTGSRPGEPCLSLLSALRSARTLSRPLPFPAGRPRLHHELGGDDPADSVQAVFDLHILQLALLDTESLGMPEQLLDRVQALFAGNEWLQGRGMHDEAVALALIRTQRYDEVVQRLEERLQAEGGVDLDALASIHLLWPSPISTSVMPAAASNAWRPPSKAWRYPTVTKAALLSSSDEVLRVEAERLAEAAGAR